jgi:hypothetical protein
MKNVHLLPTDKPSRLSYVICTEKSTLTLFEDEMEKGKRFFPQNIYITSDEEIKEGNWCIDNRNVLNKIINVSTNGYVMFKNGNSIKNTNSKKIILTTDDQLINNGVQAIDDEFLNWFVKNPSCEFVKIGLHQEPLGEVFNGKNYNTMWTDPKYQIMIPKEELKHPKVFSENGNELFFDEQGNLVIESINPCKEIVLNDKATVDVPFHNKHIRFENLTSEQANYLLQVSEFYQLSGTRRSAEIPQEELKQALVEMRKVPMTFVPDERMYSKEEVIAIVEKSRETGLTAEYLLLTDQFKKK